MSDSVRPHRWQPTRLLCPWNSPSKNTGVGCHFFLQCMKGKVKVKSLSHVRLYANPWTIQSMEFSRPEYWSGSSQPRDQTQVSHIVGRFFTSWATRECEVLECEFKWALGSITMNKVSGGDGTPVELFQILKDDAVKVLHSICQQLWKTQQWPQDWKMLVFIPILKKGNAKERPN